MISQIPRSQNAKADALALVASTKDADQQKIIPVETLDFPSIQTMKKPQTVNCVMTKDSWMTPVIQYLKDGVVPEDKRKARLLRLKAARYTLYNDQLYKRGFLTLLLKCVDLEKGTIYSRRYMKGSATIMLGGSPWLMALRQGYFWPTMKTDAMNFARKYDKFHRFSSIPKLHPEKLTSMTSLSLL